MEKVGGNVEPLGLRKTDPSIDSRWTRPLVLLGANLVFFMTTPYLSVFGILYKEKIPGTLDSDSATGTLDSNNHTSSPDSLDSDNANMKAWTFATFLLTWNFFSLFAGPLSDIRSHRTTCVCGVLLMGGGSITSAFAATPNEIVFTVGVLMGTGQGLVINTVIINLKEHFAENPSLSFGLSFTIMGLAGIITPFIDAWLLSKMSAQKCILAHGIALTVIALTGAMLLFPPPLPTKQDLANEDEAEGSHPRFDHLRRIQLLDLEDREERDSGKNEKPKFVDQSQSGWKQALYQSPYVQIFTRIKWALLKDPLFVVTALGSAYSFNALINFYLLLPLHADLYKCTVDDKASFLSIVSGVDLLTRLFFAKLGDFPMVSNLLCGKPRRMIYALTVIGFGIAMMGLSFAENYYSIAAICVIYGFFAGGMPGNGPLVFSESFNEDFSSAMGLSSIGKSVAGLSTAPLLSLTKSQSVKLSLFVHGGISIILMVVWITYAIVSDKSKRTRESNTLEDKI